MKVLKLKEELIEEDIKRTEAFRETLHKTFWPRMDKEVKDLILNEIYEKKIVEEKIYELAEKNQQLTDSIHYAELIQKSVLSSENDFTLEIPNAFTVIFPKDIVSGDFFWYHNDDDYLSYCIADATGHGVPGAFVSLLAYGSLRESFESNKL